MIDLKEIEKEIDELLASETGESLRLWLQQQLNVDKYLGKGEFINSELQEQNIVMENASRPVTVNSNLDNSCTTNSQYAQAA